MFTIIEYLFGNPIPHSEVQEIIRSMIPGFIEDILDPTMKYGELYTQLEALLNHGVSIGCRIEEPFITTHCISIMAILKTIRDYPNNQRILIDYMNNVLDICILHQETTMFSDVHSTASIHFSAN
jgi:hypothetical protein